MTKKKIKISEPDLLEKKKKPTLLEKITQKIYNHFYNILDKTTSEDIVHNFKKISKKILEQLEQRCRYEQNLNLSGRESPIVLANIIFNLCQEFGENKKYIPKIFRDMIPNIISALKNEDYEDGTNISHDPENRTYNRPIYRGN
jgi:hypothetical protein